MSVRRAADAMETDFGNVGDAENAENDGIAKPEIARLPRGQRQAAYDLSSREEIEAVGKGD